MPCYPGHSWYENRQPFDIKQDISEKHAMKNHGVFTLREVHSERENEPWLLATSLPVTSTLAKKVVKLYSARMQIEEAFRDIKSYRYGAGLELHLTQDQQRLQILTLVGMLVTLVLWLLGAVVIMSGEARHYQVNT